MLYNTLTCPHCGNDTTVRSVEEPQKCRWCRRLLLVKVTKNKGKKLNWEIEPINFSENQKQDYRKRSYNEWKDEEIYGRR